MSLLKNTHSNAPVNLRGLTLLLLALSFGAGCAVTTASGGGEDPAKPTKDDPAGHQGSEEPTDTGALDTPDDTGSQDTPDDTGAEDQPDGRTTWYYDGDGDGWGDPEASFRSESAPAGYVADRSDCDDSDGDVHPWADETCDGVDEDCDGEVDEDAINGNTYYLDLDADGYGGADTVVACLRPADATSSDNDCDDGDAAINPAATEICDDGIDQNCDGTGAGCGLEGTYKVSQADGIFYAVSSNLRLGWSADAAGDVDNDGLADILLGSYKNQLDDMPFAFVFIGGHSGTLPVTSADISIGGANLGEWPGISVAGVGDVDGDGEADLLIGAPGENSLEDAAGRAYLIDGPYSSEVQLCTDAVEIEGVLDVGQAGYLVAGAGDVDADGYDDLLVLDPDVDQTGLFGEIYLMDGPVRSDVSLGTAMATLDFDDIDGSVSMAAGDINDDGYSDVIIGLRSSGVYSAGKHEVFLGPLRGGESYSQSVCADTTQNVFYGFAVAVVGDMDSDGKGELAVGDPMASNGIASGAVYLYSGAKLSSTSNPSDATAVLWGEYVGDGAGYSVAAAGDVNGDGYADLLVGALANDTYGVGAGAAYLLLGPVSGEINLADADAIFRGVSAGDQAGRVVKGVGDTNGDGFDDILITAPYSDLGAEDGGAAYLFLGGGM